MIGKNNETTCKNTLPIFPLRESLSSFSVPTHTIG